MFATRPFVACVMAFSFGETAEHLWAFHHVLLYSITGLCALDTSSFHAHAQLNISSKRAYAQESVSLTHLELEASSIHAHLQKCPLLHASCPMRRWRSHQPQSHAQQSLPLPRAACPAEGFINPCACTASASVSHKSPLCFLKLTRKLRYFCGALWLNNSHQNYLRIFDKFPSYYRPYPGSSVCMD